MHCFLGFLELLEDTVVPRNNETCGVGLSSGSIEYAMLTNEIYKGWSGMKASEYKKLKGLRKESLRDNMTDIEVLLTDLGEIATRDIAQTEHPQGFNENMNVAKRGGQVANDARKSYEKQTKKSAISKENALNYKYIDDKKIIEDKKSKKKK